MFASATSRGLSRDSSQNADRELLRLALGGSCPNSSRLWQLHPEIFRPGSQAQLPIGWEQRVDHRSGRVFYINHNDRSTCWSDPRKKCAIQTHAGAEAAEPRRDVEEDASHSLMQEWLEFEDSDSDDDTDADASNSTGNAEHVADSIGFDRLLDSHAGRPRTSHNLHDHGATSASTLHDIAACQAQGWHEQPRPKKAMESPVDDCESQLLPIVGIRQRAPLVRTSELQLLSSGWLDPTAERLTRRVTLEYESTLAALFRALPDADTLGGKRCGYQLLQQRRLRLLQLVHLAQVREHERHALPPNRWDECYARQLAERASRHGARSGKTMVRALDSLERHSEPNLTATYTKWFQTRSHLARCNAVLATLKPLQLLEHPAVKPYDSTLRRLQDKLIGLAVTTGSEATRNSTAEVACAIMTQDVAVARHQSSASINQQPSCMPSEPPYSSVEGVNCARSSPENGSSTLSEVLRALLRIALVRGSLEDHLKGLAAMIAASHNSRRAAAKENSSPQPSAPLAVELVKELHDLESACRQVSSWAHSILLAPACATLHACNTICAC